ADDLDPKVSRRYRELGAEEPSRELDQAILAAAHRAADRPHAPLVTPAGRHRWYFAFGAVAILVLAVAITVQLDRGPLDLESIAPASAPAERKEAVADQKGPASSSPARPAAPLQEKPPQAPSAHTQNAPAAAPEKFRLQEGARKSREAAAPSAPSSDATKPKAEEAAPAGRLEPQQNQVPSVQTQDAPAAAPASPPPAQANRR